MTTPDGESKFAYINPPTEAERRQWRIEAEELQRLMEGGEFYEPLVFFVDYPGVDDPSLQELSEVDVPEEAPIVGVEVDGESCAFVLEQMTDPTRHIANLTINKVPISVSYCDLADCARVLTNQPKDSRGPNQTLGLSVGGLDINHQLVYLLRGERYGQESKGIPLADYPFERMRFDEWIQKHPDTLVYIAPKVTDNDS
ncbi:MAG: DUF3179 domain-containing (seleno)protein [Rubripirellula sp.]